MIRTAPRTDVARPGPLVLGLVLVTAMTAGFVAGQAAPDIVGSLSGTASVTTAPALTQNADYGIRHLATAGRLTGLDDYGIRLLAPPPLAPADDYGIRHLETVPLSPSDDYGIRHQDQP
ncbi:MAG TPA: hypothetical protein VFW95_05100 [Candidatus Limnocylindria bacterium]|nr:hypothetical protein [Candidatus Limnocylindria bacterium]